MTRLIVVAAAAIGLILFAAFVVARLLATRTRGLSIRMQVFVALALIVGAFAFGLGIMVIDRIEARAVRLANQAALDESAVVAGIFGAEMDRGNLRIEEIAVRLETERQRGAELSFELLDRQGRMLFPRGAPSKKGEAGTVSVDSPIMSQGQVAGSARVVKPTVVMRRLLEDFAPTVLVISLVLGAVAAAAAALIGRAIARPIENLSAFAEKVSAGERVAAPLEPAGREVTRLNRSIDSMRRQLQGRPFVEAFAADLSHELKNPVAAIRASAEVLEEGAIDEPEEARRFVTRIRESTERIERLLGDLLSLARIEARGAEDLETVDLCDAARVAIDALGDDASRIAFVTAGDTRIRGDETWLVRAVGNLLENALIHATDGGAIDLALRREEDGVVLEVANAGAVPKHVRERLFRRFVTTRSDKGGTGLGLSIVRAVAEAHGGRAELAEAGPPRVVLRLVFPPARRRASEQLKEAAGQARDALERRSRPRHDAPDEAE
ncbi:MAG: GHKL domain-containing protein [Polyangiaceae bacterium]|nr:GHKL domain-containing protein [Polyangiaceae bacterium]